MSEKLQELYDSEMGEIEYGFGNVKGEIVTLRSENGDDFREFLKNAESLRKEIRELDRAVHTLIENLRKSRQGRFSPRK